MLKCDSIGIRSINSQHAEVTHNIKIQKRKVIAVRKDVYSVLVVDADEVFADMLGRRIASRRNMRLCAKAYSGDVVVPLVQEKRPDIIIMDMTLPALDGISVMRMLQQEVDYAPVIIITSAYSNDMQNYLINDIPNAYFIRKPVSQEHILDRAEEFVRASYGYLAKASGDDIETERTLYRLLKSDRYETPLKKITGMLHELGVPAHLNGYGYIREAVCMIIDAPHLINCMTKEVYPALALRHNKSATSIEKAIRTAIEISWNRGKIEVLEEVFGFTVNLRKGKPTNTEYIAMLVDRYNVWMK